MLGSNEQSLETARKTSLIAARPELDCKWTDAKRAPFKVLLLCSGWKTWDTEMILAFRRVPCNHRRAQGLQRPPELMGDSLYLLAAILQRHRLLSSVTMLLWSREEARLCSVLLINPAERQLLAWRNTHTNTDTNVGTIPKAVENQVPTAGLEKGVRRKQGTPWRYASSGHQWGKTHVARLLLKGI